MAEKLTQAEIDELLLELKGDITDEEIAAYKTTEWVESITEHMKKCKDPNCLPCSMIIKTAEFFVEYMEKQRTGDLTNG